MIVEPRIVSPLGAVDTKSSSTSLPELVDKLAPETTPSVTFPIATRSIAIPAGFVTMNFSPLLDCPATLTVTLPVVAPSGTGTTMLVELQLLGVAEVPLKDTVP